MSSPMMITLPQGLDDDIDGFSHGRGNELSIPIAYKDRRGQSTCLRQFTLGDFSERNGGLSIHVAQDPYPYSGRREHLNPQNGRQYKGCLALCDSTYEVKLRYQGEHRFKIVSAKPSDKVIAFGRITR